MNWESNPKVMLEATKRLVKERARFCCEYCFSQERYSPDSFSMEHIIAVSRGGTDDPENLAFSCQGCNNKKYNHELAIDPATGQDVPLYNPRLHVWADHFCWDENFTLILGTSPIGRAAVDRLKLNRTGVVNLRKVLVERGEHPLKWS